MHDAFFSGNEVLRVNRHFMSNAEILVFSSLFIFFLQKKHDFTHNVKELNVFIIFLNF